MRNMTCRYGVPMTRKDSPASVPDQRQKTYSGLAAIAWLQKWPGRRLYRRESTEAGSLLWWMRITALGGQVIVGLDLNARLATQTDLEYNWSPEL